MAQPMATSKAFDDAPYRWHLNDAIINGIAMTSANLIIASDLTFTADAMRALAVEHDCLDFGHGHPKIDGAQEVVAAARSALDALAGQRAPSACMVDLR